MSGSIGAVVAAALPLMRANAESLMADRCTIERSSGTVWDEALQKSVTAWAVIHADVPCHFETAPVTSRSLVTDEAASPESPMVKAPVTVTGVKPDDRVTFTAASDPEHQGAVLWVTHVVSDTHVVERLIQCRWTR